MNRKSKAKSKQTQKIAPKTVEIKPIQLKEDVFGSYVDDAGKAHVIKRFTWKNHNKIEVQVITFGARITSLKLPSRHGFLTDVALGFDDIAGYLIYKKLYMGATIGRTTDYIENATFVLDNKQRWLTINKGNHHYNGGFSGFDKAVWTPNVSGTKLILSHVFKDESEGYPGDLFVRIIFELTSKNEFMIEMEAFTTKPTIISLSNLLYFNLSGHGCGSDETAHHIVNINANCFLPLDQKDFLPTGDIQNVIYTDNDFQIPRLLTESLQKAESGFDVHFCVNRGIDQSNCFVARAVHPPTGRMLELYSNQCGVRFSTGNHFLEPYEWKSTASTISTTFSTVTTPCYECKCDEDDSIFSFIHRMHRHVAETMSLDHQIDYAEIKRLIRDLHRKVVVVDDENEEEYQEENFGYDNFGQEAQEYWFSPLQVKYLEGMQAAASDISSDHREFRTLENVVKTILDAAMIKPEYECPLPEEPEVVSNATTVREEQSIKTLEEQKSKEDSLLSKKGLRRLENIIPEKYKDGRIHGKNNAIYKKHAGIAFQTENYPNAIYHPNFPSSVLRPGEMYRHTMVYKFWLQSGNYHKWIKRNCTTAPKG